jgi:hypothetical protein
LLLLPVSLSARIWVRTALTYCFEEISPRSKRWYCFMVLREKREGELIAGILL